MIYNSINIERRLAKNSLIYNELAMHDKNLYIFAQNKVIKNITLIQLFLDSEVIYQKN